MRKRTSGLLCRLFRPRPLRSTACSGPTVKRLIEEAGLHLRSIQGRWWFVDGELRGAGVLPRKRGQNEDSSLNGP